MESDLPCRHVDKKLPILDMKCWMENGMAYYMHYEKEVASKLIIPSRSAHSNSCKRSVHINELVRRCLNTSKASPYRTSQGTIQGSPITSKDGATTMHQAKISSENRPYTDRLFCSGVLMPLVMPKDV